MSASTPTTASDRSVLLSDGRQLAYIECGDPVGEPVFHFHGHPGSRLEALIASDAATRAGVRLIGVDRPGMGRSDFKPRRRLLEWADDIAALADALAIDKFAVEGTSGGGPYTAACAFKLADRITACGIVAGLGPIHRFGTRGMMAVNRLQFGLARRAPWLLRPMFWLYLGRHRGIAGDEDRLAAMAGGGLPPSSLLPSRPAKNDGRTLRRPTSARCSRRFAKETGDRAMTPGCSSNLGDSSLRPSSANGYMCGTVRGMFTCPSPWAAPLLPPFQAAARRSSPRRRTWRQRSGTLTRS